MWLIHRQLWVPALALVSYAILPVDWIVNRYNVSLVIAGNPASVVQIIAHRTSAEGLLPLAALTEVQDEKIREGIRALLALWANELELIDPSSSATTVPGMGDADVWHSKYGHASPWLTVDANFSKLDRTSATSWHNAQAAETLLRNRLIELEPIWIEYPIRRRVAQRLSTSSFNMPISGIRPACVQDDTFRSRCEWMFRANRDDADGGRMGTGDSTADTRQGHDK